MCNDHKPITNQQLKFHVRLSIFSRNKRILVKLPREQGETIIYFTGMQVS